MYSKFQFSYFVSLVGSYNLHVQMSTKQLMGFGEKIFAIREREGKKLNAQWDDNFDREVCKREYLYFECDELWTILFVPSNEHHPCTAHFKIILIRSHLADLYVPRERRTERERIFFKKQNKSIAKFLLAVKSTHTQQHSS